MPNVIIIKGSPRYDEAYADGAITPGHLVVRTSATQVGVHATADGAAAAVFALSSHEFSRSWDSAYEDGDRVYFGSFKKKDAVNALLADGETTIIDPPSPLVSAGDGTLKVATVDGSTLEEAVVAYAREAKTADGATRCVVVVA